MGSCSSTKEKKDIHHENKTNGDVNIKEDHKVEVEVNDKPVERDSNKKCNLIKIYI